MRVEKVFNNTYANDMVARFQVDTFGIERRLLEEEVKTLPKSKVLDEQRLGQLDEINCKLGLPTA